MLTCFKKSADFRWSFEKVPKEIRRTYLPDIIKGEDRNISYHWQRPHFKESWEHACLNCELQNNSCIYYWKTPPVHPKNCSLPPHIWEGCFQVSLVSSLLVLGPLFPSSAHMGYGRQLLWIQHNLITQPNEEMQRSQLLLEKVRCLLLLLHES